MGVVLKYVLWAVAVALIVVGLSFWAYSSLDDAGRLEVYQEILKLSYQFLVIVLLGLLVSASLEAGRESRATMQARRSRKEGFAKSLVDLTHEIDLARLLIMANRSARTWDTQMNERIVPAYIRLRDLSHDVKTAKAADDPIFTQSDEVRKRLDQMTTQIEPLVNEFAEQKKNLDKFQLQAEEDPSNPSLQERLWAEMLALPELEDLVHEGAKYKTFRKDYVQLLQLMRSELNPRGKSAVAATDPSTGDSPVSARA